VIRVYPDLESLSQAAAGLFVQQAAEAVAARGRFSVALSGGSTPRRTYELLAQPPCRDQVSWDRLHVFWGDERCVPEGDPRRNALLAQHTFLNSVPIPPAQIHPIFCQRSPGEAAAEYEALLREFFTGQPPRFDLIFLGLGGDGHTASLFPRTGVLQERQKWAAEVYVPEQGLYRVTLTAALINQAALVAFLVSGADKAKILKEVLTGPSEPLRLPAQLIRPEGGRLLWLVDQDAAKEMEETG
jgi:6-phosphogluconolactonase